jgi:hypothetical protein
MTISADVHAYQNPSVEITCRPSGASSDIYWLKIGPNATIYLTPNQALKLRDVLVNNPDLCAYEAECEKEENPEPAGVRRGDAEEAF